MRVVFFGNHTVGVRTLDALCEAASVVGVVAHPEDPEDGVRYASVYDQARALGLSVERLGGRDERLAAFVRDAEPDLLWLTDYRYLVPGDVLALAPQGAVNLHPSLLPAYRGRAPLNWAILNGETEFGLTAHFVNAQVDAGDIIAQERFHLSEDEDVGDALDRLYPLYARLTRRVIALFEQGDVPRSPQTVSGGQVLPARRPEDGRIDWAQQAEHIRRLVRAVAAPYPGAFTTLWGRMIYVWKAEWDASCPWAPAGRVVAVYADGGFRVACGEGTLRVKHWTTDGEVPVSIGDQLGTVAPRDLAATVRVPALAAADNEMNSTASRVAFARVADHFGALVRQHGYGHEAIDYGSRMGQRQRFDVLTETLTLEGRRVLDVGCGFADLAEYLNEREIGATYEGIDICPELIEEARRRHPGLPLKVCNLLDEDPQEPCDVAIANGIFYLLGGEAEGLMQRIVVRMFELAREAVAFTSLSTWADHREPNEYHADPRRVLEFCQTLTPRVTLRHDYMPHDFAVFLMKCGGAT